MKKSFEESIQYMREQNWIKMWLDCQQFPSLDDATAQMKIRSRYDVMKFGHEGTSIILGVNSCKFDDYIQCTTYTRAIRRAMYEWMFNIEG